MLSKLTGWFSRRRRKPETLVVDDQGVRRELGDGRVEQITWAELSKVWIAITDKGPWVEDVFFVLEGDGKTGCVVSQELACQYNLLERLQKLPDFDHEAVIKAMGCTENRRFDCLSPTS